MMLSLLLAGALIASLMMLSAHQPPKRPTNENVAELEPIEQPSEVMALR